MERSGIIEWLDERLDDPRNPDSTVYPMAELLRTHWLLSGRGGRDQDDADRQRCDPSFRVGGDSHRGTTPLGEGNVLASQPTLSRLLDVLSRPGHRAVMHEAVTERACRRIRMGNGGRRRKTSSIDGDALPVAVYAHQPGSELIGPRAAFRLCSFHLGGTLAGALIRARCAAAGYIRARGPRD